MNISSVQNFTPTLYEPKEVQTGQKDSGIVDGSNDDITKVKVGESSKEESSKESSGASKSQAELSSSEKQQVMELSQRDTEVRAHEAAHIASGGSAISGSASFTYQKGPDGKLYAIGGEVPISTSGANSPEEKIALAKQVQAGALAPANPSPQDLKVASSAAVMESRARQELALETKEELQGKASDAYSNEDKTEDIPSEIISNIDFMA